MATNPPEEAILPGHGDIFVKTWGATTTWRAQAPKPLRLRHGLGHENNAAHKASCLVSRSTYHNPSDINKPLPPLPGQKIITAVPRPDLAVIQIPNHYRSSTTLSSPPSFSGRLFFGKRKSIFWPLTKKRHTHLIVQPQPPPEVLSPAALYADKGTQTLPWPLPVTEEPSLNAKPEKRPSRSGWYFFAKTPSPASSRYSPHSTSLFPNLSPRVSRMLGGPEQDYFSPRSRSPTTTHRRKDSSEVPNYAARDEAVVEVMSESLRRQEDGNERDRREATSESRYSPLPGEDSNRGGRPVLSRKPASDSTLHGIARMGKVGVHNFPNQLQISASEATGKQLLLKNMSSGQLSRPLPIPFQRFPSFSGRPRYRRHPSSDSTAGVISPLRQEVKVHENGSLEPLASVSAPAVPNIFRVPVQPGLASPEIYTDIPDHLPSSPLCPRHRKHKSGGTGFCPLHGQRSVDSDSSSTQTSHNLSRSSSSVGHGSEDEGTAFALGYPDHEFGSPLCPASTSGKGICVYHGRGKPKGSEESIPKVAVV